MASSVRSNLNIMMACSPLFSTKEYMYSTLMPLSESNLKMAFNPPTRMVNPLCQPLEPQLQGLQRLPGQGLKLFIENHQSISYLLNGQSLFV